MTCPCVGGNPANLHEVVKCVEPTLFHRVDRPASLGDDTTTPADQLDYKNVLLVYEANGHAYLYSSDGIPTFISMGDVDTAELEAKIAELAAQIEQVNTDAQEGINDVKELVDSIDSNLQNQITELEESVNTQLDSLDNAIESLDNEVEQLGNTEVQTDTQVSGDASTVSITKTTGQLNGNKTETAMPLPVASETSAGVMNPATFSAVQENSENIDSILNGAVLIEDLPANPTQAELTAQWEAETGKTTLINRASIYDKTNGKIWYYYTNVNEWEPADIQNPEITVSQATNDSLGIVKGSTENGQVAVEADGTMSLNGYDGLTHDVDNLAELVAGIEVPKVPTRVAGYGSGQKIAKWTYYYNGSYPTLEIRTTNSTTGLSAFDINGNIAIPMAGAATGVPGVTSDGLMSANDKTKLNALPAITEIGENLELTDEGVLNATGGGSEYQLPAYVMGSNSGQYTGVWVVTHPTNGTGSKKDGSLDLTNYFYNTETGAQTQVYRTFPVAETTANGLMSYPDKAKLDSLLEIKSLNDSLELDENGQLSVVGGGGSDVNILTAYTASPAEGDVYGALWVNNKFYNSRGVLIGNGAGGTGTNYVGLGVFTGVASGGVAIGHSASNAGFLDSIALGASAKNTRANELAVGTQQGNRSNQPVYIANIRAGELPTDAVNLQQMQDYVAEHSGGGSSNLAEYTLSAPNLEQLLYVLPTAESVVLRGNVTLLSDAEGGANVALTTLPAASDTKAGLLLPAEKTKLSALGVGSLTNMDGVLQSETEVQIEFARNNLTTGATETQTATIEAATSEEAGVMLATDKVKLDAIPALTEMQWTRSGNLPPAVVTGFEDTTYGTDTITMHLDTKDLATGGVAVQELMLEAATANTAEAGGQAGLMTAFQATQLAALAEAGVVQAATADEITAAWEAA